MSIESVSSWLGRLLESKIEAEVKEKLAVKTKKLTGDTKKYIWDTETLFFLLEEGRFTKHGFVPETKEKEFDYILLYRKRGSQDLNWCSNLSIESSKELLTKVSKTFASVY